jgi:hypothetical protein
MKSILSEFKESGLLFDKTTQSLTALPYEYNDVKIKVNDFVTSAVYNKCIQKLYYNLLFLYRACNVANFDLFNTYSFSLCTDTDNVLKNYNLEKQFYETKNDLLSGTKEAVLINTEFSNNNLNFLICINDKSVSVFSLNKEGSSSLFFNSTLVNGVSSDIKYSNLVDIKNSGDNNLYIVDDVYNNVYHYDISNLNKNENIFNKKLVLKNLIGGDGDVNERNRFGKIKNIAVNDNFLVVQDYENRCFKIYDKNLNWINTCIFYKLFKENEFFTCILLGKDNTLYCGKGKTIYKFNLVEKELIFEKEYYIGSYFRDEEEIQNLKLFQADKNIIYILTQTSIKKVWITLLDYIIGQYDIDNSEGVELKWLTTTRSEDEQDILSLYSTNGIKENFSLYYDKISLNSLLDVYDFPIYSLKEDLYLNKEEYVQCWTLIKNFKKLFYDVLLLIKNIKYRYKEENLGRSYPSIKKKIYNVNLLGFYNQIKFDDDFIIGVNEILQSDIINRCVQQIVNLQSVVVVYLINNMDDSVYLSPEPEKAKSTVKKYFYFVDESLIMSPNPVKLDVFEALSPGPGIVASIGGAPLEGISGISITEGVNI